MESLKYPIIAYRTWRIDRATGFLQSLFARTLWYPGIPLKAVNQYNPRLNTTCPRHGAHCEIIDCIVGVYAMKHKNDLLPPTYSHGGHIMGKVALWGRIQEHQYGYKAAQAYPMSFEHFVCENCVSIHDKIFRGDYTFLCHKCISSSKVSRDQFQELDTKVLRELESQYFIGD